MDRFNPQDFIDMLIDAGFRLTEPKKETQAIAENMNALRAIANIDKKTMRKDKLIETIAEHKLQVLKRLKNYGWK